MKVFLAGGLGAVGRECVRQLVAEGHSVVATTRKPARVTELAQMGAEGIVVDVFDSDALTKAVVIAAPEVVMHQLTALPKTIPNPRRVARELALTSRLRAEVTPVLAEAASRAGARRLIAQSVAFLYAPGGDLKTEEDPLYADCPAAFRGLVDGIRGLEAATLGADLEGVVLRYGYFYGPDTYYAADGDFSAQVRRRRLPVFGGGPGQFSLIHVEDAAAAAVAAVSGGPAGVYNIVDDEPVTMAEFVDSFADLIGAKAPPRLPTWLGRLGGGPYAEYLMCQQRGSTNIKAKRELGLRLCHPSWRAGMRALHGG